MKKPLSGDNDERTPKRGYAIIQWQYNYIYHSARMTVKTNLYITKRKLKSPKFKKPRRDFFSWVFLRIHFKFKIF